MKITPDEARRVFDLASAAEDRILLDKCLAYLRKCYRCPLCDGVHCEHGWKDELEPKEQPRPMHSAPRDGTVILAFIDGTDYAQPVRCAIAINGRGSVSWRMAWDDSMILNSDLLGWLPAPLYTGPAVR